MLHDDPIQFPVTWDSVNTRDVPESLQGTPITRRTIGFVHTKTCSEVLYQIVAACGQAIFELQVRTLQFHSHPMTNKTRRSRGNNPPWTNKKMSSTRRYASSSTSTNRPSRSCRPTQCTPITPLEAQHNATRKTQYSTASSTSAWKEAVRTPAPARTSSHYRSRTRSAPSWERQEKSATCSIPSSEHSPRSPTASSSTPTRPRPRAPSTIRCGSRTNGTPSRTDIGREILSQTTRCAPPLRLGYKSEGASITVRRCSKKTATRKTSPARTSHVSFLSSNGRTSNTPLLTHFVLTGTRVQTRIPSTRTSKDGYEERDAATSGVPLLERQRPVLVDVVDVLVYSCICIVYTPYNASYEYPESKGLVRLCQEVVEL